MTIQNPHDRFFRESFGRLEIARNYLEEYLPTEVSELLNLDVLALQQGSFVDEAMQTHHTDLIYQAALKTGEPIFVYFLFEHKSYPDKLVALQLLRYMVQFWESMVKQEEELAPIIPLVLYHGAKRWLVPTSFLPLLSAPAGLHPYLPDFHYHLNDFSHWSDETIRGEIWLQVTLSVLRTILHPRAKDELEGLVNLMFQLGQQRTGLEYIRTILYYLSEATGRVKREDLQIALSNQGGQGEETMTTIAQEFIQIGIERGREKQHEKIRQIARQLLTLHDPVTVSEITELPLDEVLNLQKEMTGG